MGDTGSGKSTLLASLLLLRSDYIVVRTKPDDVKWQGKRVRTVKDIDDPRQPYWILEPRHERQYQEIANAYEKTWREEGWCLCIDELFYVDDYLRLGRYTTRAMTQGRSKHLTMVVGMQRPVSVTRFALSQSTHLIVFQQDDRDALTISQAAGGRPLRDAIMSLDRHEFVWYHRAERKFWRGRFDPRTGQLEGLAQDATTLARKR